MKSMRKQVNIRDKRFIAYKKYQHAYTLVELMVVVMIIAILAAIALPSYQQYKRKNALSNAKQEMLKLAEQLERYKGRNFSYKDFNPEYLYNYTNDNGANANYYDEPNGTLNLPLGSDVNNKEYTLTIVDLVEKKPLSADDIKDNKNRVISSVLGQGWAIKAVPKDTRNYAMLLTSTGISCEVKATESLIKLNNFENCEDDSDDK